MIIRSIKQEDFCQLAEIHEKFFKEEFAFPDFVTHYICGIVAEEDDRIVAAMGLRNILECVALSNLSLPIRARRKAYYDLLAAMKYVAMRNGHNSIHAFVQGDVWFNVLNRVGFNSTRGNAIILEVS